MGHHRAAIYLTLVGKLRTLFGFFRGNWKQRSIHLVRNMIMGIINSTLIVFVAAWLWAADLALEKRIGLLNLVELPAWAHALGSVVLLDFWTYWWHRFNHVVPLFWRFHRVHHSDNHMDVTTANRFHFARYFFHLSSASRSFCCSGPSSGTSPCTSLSCFRSYCSITPTLACRIGSIVSCASLSSRRRWTKCTTPA